MAESWHLHLRRKQLKVRSEVCYVPSSSHHLRGKECELQKKLPLPRWLVTFGTLVTSLCFIALLQFPHSDYQQLLKTNCSWDPTGQRHEWELYSTLTLEEVGGGGISKRKMGSVYYKEERKAGCKTMKDGLHIPLLVT